MITPSSARADHTHHSVASVFFNNILMWVILITLVLAYSPVRADEKMVLSTGVLKPYTTPDRQGFLDQLISVVFRDLGIEAEILLYPTAIERSLINANDGVTDGEVMRVAGLEKLYPNLIRVPEEVILNDFVAYTTGVPFVTDSWDSLKPYTVTHLIGWKIFEQNVPKGTEITLARDVDQMFGLLKSKRADIALYERWQGLVKAREMGFKVQVLEPALVHTKMYMYLHKKHAALVPRVAQVLVKMKQDGRYQKIVDKTLKPYAN